MSTVRMVAIDGATVVSGMALFVGGELKDYGKIDLANMKDTQERLLEMGKRIYKALDIWKPEIVYMEEPQGHGKNLYVAGLIHELIGFAKAWCVNNNAYIETVAPSVWRSRLEFRQGGKVKREELKQQSMQFVQDMFGVNVIDDISDAICIGCSFVKVYEEESDNGCR